MNEEEYVRELDGRVRLPRRLCDAATAREWPAGRRPRSTQPPHATASLALANPIQGHLGTTYKQLESQIPHLTCGNRSTAAYLKLTAQ
jgi:hypothetical protein